MKILLVFLVIILLLFYFISLKNKNFQENFTNNTSFIKNFSTDYFYPKFYLSMRDETKPLSNDFIPNNILYNKLADEFEDEIDESSEYPIFVKKIIPNFKFIINIPSGSALEKTFISYKIENLDKNISDKNFLFYKLFRLDEFNPSTPRKPQQQLFDFQKAIEENKKEKYSSNEENAIIYELPTRLEGDTRDDKDNIILQMFLFFFKYELTLNIYLTNSLQESIKKAIDNMSVSYQLGNKKIVTLKQKSKSTDKTLNEEKIVNGTCLLKNLFLQIMSIILNPEHTIDIDDKTEGDKQYEREKIELKVKNKYLNGKNFTLYVYNTTDKTKKYHGKKIKEILQTIFYYFEKSIDDIKSEKTEPSIPKNDLEHILKIIEIMITKPSGLDNMNQKEFMKISGRDSNNLKDQEEYLDMTKEVVGKELLSVYNKISIKNEIKEIELNAEKLQDMEKFLVQDPSELPKKKLLKYEVKYKFDISDFSPQEMDYGELAPDMSPDAVEKRFVSQLTTRQKLIYHLQINLRIASRERDKKFSIDADFLTAELKYEIKLVRDTLKSRYEGIRKQANENIELIQLIMDCINTRKIHIINYILDFDVLDNDKPFLNYLKEELQKIKNESALSTNSVTNTSPEPSPSDGFTSYTPQIGKQQHNQELRDNYKKNMTDIYKRFQNIKMKILNDKNKYSEESNDRVILEKFEDLRFHQHGPTGQMNFIYPLEPDSAEVGAREFEDEKWLKEPSNMRLLNTYQFLTAGQKEGILKELDNMEKTLNNLDNYSNRNLMDIKEKLYQIEEKAKEELREEQRKQVEAQMTDLEKAMLYFNETESSQEKKITRINEKIDKIEKENKDLNLDRFDKINSIRSLGDGQVISVIPKNNNMYQLRANQGCVSHTKKKEGVQLKVEDCQETPGQNFKLHHITNLKQYNEHLKKPVDDLSEVYYPFHILTTPNDKNKCMSVRGNKTSMNECEDSVYHRFESLRTIKKCDSKYGN